MSAGSSVGAGLVVGSWVCSGEEFMMTGAADIAAAEGSQELMWM